MNISGLSRVWVTYQRHWPVIELPTAAGASIAVLQEPLAGCFVMLNPMATILIVEDDALLLDALTGQLQQLEFGVHTASSVAEATTLLQSQAVDGIILDLGLPGADGMELLTWARTHIAGLPVLILTARDGVEDRVLGLNAGADDYITKPFNMQELQARLQAMLRRARQPAGGAQWRPARPDPARMGAAGVAGQPLWRSRHARRCAGRLARQPPGARTNRRAPAQLQRAGGICAPPAQEARHLAAGHPQHPGAGVHAEQAVKWSAPLSRCAPSPRSRFAALRGQEDDAVAAAAAAGAVAVGRVSGVAHCAAERREGH